MLEIFTRRSIRKFSDKKVSSVNTTLILKAAMAAPSALNEQPWEFILVDKEELKEKLSLMSNHSSFINKASFIVVVLGNKDYVKSSLYHQDLAAAVENMMLEARHLGIGSCWIGTYPKEDRMTYVSDLFNLPENIESFAVVAFGYPSEEEAFKELNRFNESRIHRNEW